MFLLYDALLLIAAAVLVPFYTVRGLRFGKRRHGLRERFGYYGEDRLSPLAGKPVIWVHAVSVGETRAAIPLLKALRQRYPGHALLVTNVTETGHEISSGIKEVDLCLFYPFDFSGAVRRAIRAIRPELIVIVETEIWPNFVRIAEQSGIPVALVNGRISDRSFPRYRLARPFLRPVLRLFSAFCMQSETDARRIAALGAPSSMVQVTRNLKFDMPIGAAAAETVTDLRRRYCLPDDQPVWVAGSTHTGEEEIVADLYRRLRGKGKGGVLVLVPRHPERSRAVAEMLRRRGLPVVLRSTLAVADEPLQPGHVLLVDTLGEMLALYRAADLVFVGGSLIPIGGHNILEASLVERPVVFGPYMQNFKEIANLLQQVGGGLQVAGGEELEAAIDRLLDDPALRRHMGECGHRLISANAGATDQTMQVLCRLLEGGNGAAA